MLRRRRLGPCWKLLLYRSDAFNSFVADFSRMSELSLLFCLPPRGLCFLPGIRGVLPCFNYTCPILLVGSDAEDDALLKSVGVI